jgi:hypothetical protein
MSPAFWEFTPQLLRRLKMNRVQSYRLSSFNVFDIIVDEQRPRRVDVVAIEQDAIKLGKGLACFLDSRHDDALKPMEEIKSAQRPGKGFRRPVGKGI